jgi:hypothetical protein
MLKILPKKFNKSSKIIEPKNKTLFAILNYSKSLSKVKICEKKILVNLN